MYRHQDSDTTIHSSSAYGILIVIFLPLPPHRISRHCKSDESTGVENVGGQRDLVARRLHGGRTFEEAVNYAVEENGRTGRVGGFVGKVVC